MTHSDLRPVERSRFQDLFPFRSRFADIGGLRYHYIDEGAGEPIVMVHGNPTWSFYFRALITTLSAHYRTIAPDHIGCGWSEKPAPDRYDFRLRSRILDLSLFLDTLGLEEKITLVMHDWGGMIGIGYAVSCPERIGRIVLMNTAAFLSPKGKPLPFRLRLARNSGLLAPFLIQGLNLFVLGALLMASRKGLSGPVRRGLAAPYNCWRNRTAVLKFVQDIPIKKTDPSFELVRYVGDHLHVLADHPKLICWGERDFVFDGDYLTEWRERFPDAEIHSFPDAGHYVLEDEPGAVVQHIRNFLKKHPL